MRGRWVDRMLGAHSAAVYVFFYAPIAVLVFLSFNDNKLVTVWGGASLRWYREMLQNGQVQSAIKNSLIVATVSTVVSTVLGTAAALGLERFRWRGQRLFDGLLYLPIIIPDVTMAVMMLVFFVQVFGLVETAFGPKIGLGLATISLSHIAFNISFVAVVVRARLAGLDPALEEAATSHSLPRRRGHHQFRVGARFHDLARLRFWAGETGRHPPHQRGEHRHVGSVDGARLRFADLPAR